jgi:biopolymer transport protein ExbB
MNENTFSLGQIWAQGDSVSHAVAIILIVMSLASWSVILIKAWSLMQLRRMSAAAKQFWHSTSFRRRHGCPPTPPGRQPLP